MFEISLQIFYNIQICECLCNISIFIVNIAWMSWNNILDGYLDAIRNPFLFPIPLLIMRHWQIGYVDFV